MGIGIRQRGWFAALSTMVWLLILVSCSGGGGDGWAPGNLTPAGRTMTAADLSGGYRGGVIGFDPEGQTEVVDVTFDGNGTFKAKSILVDPGNLEHGSYTVSTDGTLTADARETGQLSTDGNIFHLVDADASDDFLSLSIGLKKSSGMTADALSGTYHVFFIFSGAGYDCQVQSYGVSINGAGTITFPPPTLPGPDLSVGYTVDDDGGLTIDGQGIHDIGQVSPNGDIFFFVENGILAIGIRQSPGMTNADLAGTFHAVAMGDSAVDNDAFTSLYAGRAEISPDGAGNVSITPIEDSDGTVDSPSTGTGIVADDGTITGDGDVTGQLSPDMGFFIMANDAVSDNNSEIIIGILKP